MADGIQLPPGFENMMGMDPSKMAKINEDAEAK